MGRQPRNACNRLRRKEGGRGREEEGGGWEGRRREGRTRRGKGDERERRKWRRCSRPLQRHPCHHLSATLTNSLSFPST